MELLIIFVLFGPKYLPKLAKRVGQSLRDWKELGQEKSDASGEVVEVKPIEIVKDDSIQVMKEGPIEIANAERTEFVKE
ncbi:MAG: twin-arginine translocase TatA/TatE family subunit [Lachnospiraceae bacterium]|nr:twin-arginine translocase TatA/TatE family subunit [Lachnospiraceae bacterium]